MAQPPQGEEGGGPDATTAAAAPVTNGSRPGVVDDGEACLAAGGEDAGMGQAAEHEDEEAARERLKADIKVHNVNVAFSRIMLDDKALLRGFRIKRWVEAQLHQLIDRVVDGCEGKSSQGEGLDGEEEEEDDELAAAARAEAAEMEEAMKAMGWAPGEVPLSFGGGAKQQGSQRRSRPQQQQEEDVEGEEGGAWAPQVGAACECLYEEDGRWYPARVDAVSEEQEGDGEPATIKVTYLGYDETRRVPLTHLRPPPGAGGGGGGGGGKGRKRPRKSSPSSSFFPTDGLDEEPSGPPPPQSASNEQQQEDRDEQGHPVCRQPPRKYWMQRFRLFSQFDRGVRLDHEGWFSVTPERIAAHIAERSRCDVVADLFVGCGGNAIQFALTCHQVLGVDMDPAKLSHARHNARVYGVADRLELVQGNALDVLPYLRGKVDVLFMSPPWGGPEYLAQARYRLDDMQVGRGVGGRELLARVLAVCPNVAVLLPRNVDLAELAAVAGGRALEVEENWLNYKLKTITAYFGDYFLPAPPHDKVLQRQAREEAERERRRRKRRRKRQRKGKEEGEGEEDDEEDDAEGEQGPDE